MMDWLVTARHLLQAGGRIVLAPGCLLIVMAFAALGAKGQMPRGVPDASGHVQGAPDAEDEAQHQMEKKLEKRRNEDRQRDLVRDTNKLLALATDLKTEVDKTNKDVLSVDVVKKAEEIEKLARSVKERMRSSL